MRKVILNMTEQYKYEIIKKLVETTGNKNTASIKLKCSRRNINILIKKYINEGKDGFVHGNKNRVPSNAISEDLKSTIIFLYENKYDGANWKHFKELLAEKENIYISYNSLYILLKGKGAMISPMCTRRIKNERAKLIRKKNQLNIKLTEYESELVVCTNILDPKESHARISRAKYFGEILQMDASDHKWFNNEKSQLHAAIDDSTGIIVGAYFDKQETLNGYYHVLDQILSNYGVPCKFLTDNRTVFEYKQKKNPSLEKDYFTQFGYACHQFGIDIETSSVAQRKGRIERLWGTLQSRLITELKLAGIRTIEEANKFLELYIIKFNQQFSLPYDNTKNSFESKPSKEQINNILSICSTRIFDNGCSIKYKNKYYQPFNNRDILINFYRGTKCLVIETYDNKLICSVENIANKEFKTYILKEVPLRKTYSKELDFSLNVVKTNIPHIPKMSHPWKRASFIEYVNKQKHHKKSQISY